jgi:hypothetical protein
MACVARLGCVLLGLALAGCAAGPSGSSCPLPGQTRMTELKLYFGRDIPGGGFVDDTAWRAFSERVLTPAFPEGFTVTEGLGQWMNPHNGMIKRERSFVVDRVGVVNVASVEAAMAAYRTQFKQVSVGRLTTEACAGFD